MSEAEQQCCFPNTEPYDVYDDLERLQRQVALLEKELETAKKLVVAWQRARDYWMNACQQKYDELATLRRDIESLGEKVRRLRLVNEYWESAWQNRYQRYGQLQDYVSALMERSLLQRILNTKPDGDNLRPRDD